MEINILKKLGEAGRRGEGGTIVYQKKTVYSKKFFVKFVKILEVFTVCRGAFRAW